MLSDGDWENKDNETGKTLNNEVSNNQASAEEQNVRLDQRQDHEVLQALCVRQEIGAGDAWRQERDVRSENIGINVLINVPGETILGVQ